MTFVDRLAGLSADGTEQERTRKEQWFATMVRVLALLRQDLGVARDRMSFVCIPMLLNDDRVPELVDLIEALPDGDTAYLYLHSGQPDLEDAAYDFYRQYRYFDTAKMDGPLPRKRR